MKTQSIALLTVLVLAFGSIGCTNMNKTQQGGLSGAAIGAGAGAGIAAIAGGSGTTGAIIGGVMGLVAGGIYGHNQQQNANNR